MMFRTWRSCAGQEDSKKYKKREYELEMLINVFCSFLFSSFPLENLFNFSSLFSFFSGPKRDVWRCEGISLEPHKTMSSWGAKKCLSFRKLSKYPQHWPFFCAHRCPNEMKPFRTLRGPLSHVSLCFVSKHNASQYLWWADACKSFVGKAKRKEKETSGQINKRWQNEIESHRYSLFFQLRFPNGFHRNRRFDILSLCLLPLSLI